MLLSVFFLIIGLSISNAQIYIEDFSLSKSQEVTHLRVEYHLNDDGLENDSMTYSLWKGNTKSFDYIR